jgi:hypothetical protein
MLEFSPCAATADKQCAAAYGTRLACAADELHIRDVERDTVVLAL